MRLEIMGNAPLPYADVPYLENSANPFGEFFNTAGDDR